MSKRTFFLKHAAARDGAARFCFEAPADWMVVFSEPTKKRAQEEKYHAMIGEIARHCTHAGQKWEADDWKRLLIDLFADEMRAAGTPLHHDGRVVPSLDGRRIVQLGIQSRDFYVKEAAQFIEFLYAFAAQNGIALSEK